MQQTGAWLLHSAIILRSRESEQISIMYVFQISFKRQKTLVNLLESAQSYHQGKSGDTGVTTDFTDAYFGQTQI